LLNNSHRAATRTDRSSVPLGHPILLITYPMAQGESKDTP